MGGGLLRPIVSNRKYSGGMIRSPQMAAIQNIIFANLTVPSRAAASSTHGLAVEPAESCGKQQRVEKNQPSEDRHQRQVWELGHQGGAQAFAGVDQGINEHGFLKNGKLLQRAPGIVSAAKKDHGRHDEAEHQADVVLRNATAQRKSAGRRKKRHEH